MSLRSGHQVQLSLRSDHDFIHRTPVRVSTKKVFSFSIARHVWSSNLHTSKAKPCLLFPAIVLVLTSVAMVPLIWMMMDNGRQDPKPPHQEAGRGGFHSCPLNVENMRSRNLLDIYWKIQLGILTYITCSKIFYRPGARGVPCSSSKWSRHSARARPRKTSAEPCGSP